MVYVSTFSESIRWQGLDLLLMQTETRIPFSFSFGSHGQCFLLAVGFGLRTTHDRRKLRGDCGYPYQDIKGEALG
ncbi:MAG: hypothetical protein EXQ58_00875 [Acidobacteria bacterium]|nr:hypothetical protein [Acidobacteriota bacterium]